MAHLRTLAPVLLLAFFALSVVANDCDICRASNTADCSMQGTATADAKTKPDYIHGATSCADALKLVTCGQCKNGAAAKQYGVSCCTLSCNNNGKGNIETFCACGPPAAHDNQGTTAGVCQKDPHFRGAFGIEYDFHGVADRDFNLISDQNLSINAHFISQNGEETGVDGTWISALGFKWAEKSAARTATFSVKEGAAFNERIPFAVWIDGRELLAESFVAVVGGRDEILYQDEGLVISVAHPFAYSCRVVIRDLINIIVTAATHEHPNGNHIDIRISQLNVTDTVHGALGQTFVASRAESLKAAALGIGSFQKFDAADVVEGKDVDYMTASLTATDFKFNRFDINAGSAAKMDVITRKLLGVETETTSVQTVVGELACVNMPGGGLACST